MADNGYQSGGKNYSSPNRQIETGIQRDVLSQVGDKSQIKAMQIDEVLEVILNTFDKFARDAQLTSAQMEKAKDALTKDVQSSTNANTAMKSGTDRLTRIIASNANLMQNFQKVRGTDSGKGVLGSVNNSPFLQSVHIQQEMLNRLGEMSEKLSGLEKSEKTEQAQEETLFESLKQTVMHSIFNSPTATKLGSLGASLMSAGLFRIASNENAPKWVRQLSMGAVYLQIPQTLMNIIGAVVQTSITQWLGGIGGKAISGAIGNSFRGLGGIMANSLKGIGGYIAPMLSAALPFIITGAIAVGAIALHKFVTGKADKAIDNSKMTQKQKNWSKVGVHTGSGALAGAGIGAAVGTFIFPGIGTALGAGIGAGIGGIVGAIKPLKEAYEKGGLGFKGAFALIGSKIASGFKWLVGFGEKLLGFVKPVLQIVRTLLEITSPFFMLMKLFSQAIMRIPFIRNLLKKPSGNPENTVLNPGESGGVGRNLERFLDRGSTKYTKDKAGRTYLGGHLITSDYGWRIHPTGTGSAKDGQKQFHKGIDLAYKSGEKVGAMVGGKVVFAGQRSGYGNTVEIQDDKGVIHKYHHGSAIPQAIIQAYKTGGSVKQGDTIMQAGKTGYATGVHLDYETWKDGQHINPLEYLASREEEKIKAKAAEEERKKKEKEEKEKAEAERRKNNPNIIDKISNKGKAIIQDITDTGKYTDEQNRTEQVTNRGM